MTAHSFGFLPLHKLGLLFHDLLSKLVGALGVNLGVVGLFFAGREAGRAHEGDSGMGFLVAAVGGG